MKIYSLGNTETYLYLNGLKISRPISLDKQVELLPASCDPTPSDIIDISKTEIDLGINAIFLRRIGSQLKITADNPKELAIKSWNSLWILSLLSAIFDNEIVCNIQSDKSAEAFCSKSKIEITNYGMRGLAGEYMATEKDYKWIQKYFSCEYELLTNRSVFMDTVCAMSQYRWHPNPRTKLAVLWSGIEGLSNIHSEISFRLSLYIANYVYPNDKQERLRLFSHVKTLYGHRSASVHGSTMTEKSRRSVQDSAALLNHLIRICVERNELPNTKELVL